MQIRSKRATAEHAGARGQINAGFEHLSTGNCWSPYERALEPFHLIAKWINESQFLFLPGCPFKVKRRWTEAKRITYSIDLCFIWQCFNDFLMFLKDVCQESQLW